MNQKSVVSIGIYILFYFLIVLISIGMGYLVQTVPLIKTFDNYFYELINGLPHPHAITQLINPFDLWFLPYPKIFFLPAFFYFLLAGLFLYVGIFQKSLLPWAIISIVLGFALAGLLLSIDWHFIFRHRPFESLPSTVDAVSRKTLMKFPSYPSGHVRDTTVVSTIIAYFIPKLAWIMGAFVLFIAFTRIYTGAHYPTDVMAGIVFGYFVALITIKIVTVFQPSIHTKTIGAKKHDNTKKPNK